MDDPKAIGSVFFWMDPQMDGVRGNHSNPLDGLPSGYVKIAIENGHRNSGFTH